MPTSPLSRIVVISAAMLALHGGLCAQVAPVIAWEKSYGGDGREDATCVTPTRDGGYILAGSTTSQTSGDVVGNHGSNYDYWIVKVDQAGVIEWKKCYGGRVGDIANAIVQTPDGGYAISGYTGSSDGDINHSIHGGEDFWIVRIDPVGTILWENNFGGSANDYAAAIANTRDGGFIVAGTTYSNDDDVSGNHGANGDQWVIKLNAAGALQWQKCYGGAGDDEARDIIPTTDGGYVIAGCTYSNDIPGYHGRSDTTNCKDFWIVKIDSVGDTMWTRALGGIGDDDAYSIVQASDGGYIVAGSSESNDGDVTGHHGATQQGDCWIVRLSPTGTMQWQRSLGGTGRDGALSLITEPTGDITCAAYALSPASGDITTPKGASDYWIVQLTALGVLKWQTSLGGSSQDIASSITLGSDGGYVVLGSAQSDDGDVTGHHAPNTTTDYWLVKLRYVWPVISSETSIEMHGTPCDSMPVDTIWVHNTGGGILALSGATVSGPNASRFRLLSPLTFPDSLLPGDSIAFVIQYSAPDASGGVASLFITSNDTITSQLPWQIRLQGQIDRMAWSAPVFVDMGTVPLGSTHDTTFVLHNTGTADLCIRAINWLPVFTITPPLTGGILKAGDSIVLTLHYAPTRDSADSAFVRFDVSCPCPDSFTIGVAGRGVDPTLTPRIDGPTSAGFATQSCDSLGVDTMYITNIGEKSLVISSGMISGTDASFFTLVEPTQFPDTIAPGGRLRVIVRFFGDARPTRSAALSLANNDTLAAHNPWVIALSAHVDSAVAVFPALFDFGAVDLGATVDTSITLSNFGSIDLCVLSSTPTPDFTILSPAIPFTIPPGGNVVLRVRFNPAVDSTYRDTARFSLGCLCADQRSIAFVGSGVQCGGVISADSVSLPILEGRVGDTVDIPVHIALTSNFLVCAARQYEMRMRYDRTLLDPVVPWPGADTGFWRTVTISGALADSTNILTTLRFVAALGDTSETPLHIESFTWATGTPVTTTTDGTFSLTNICYANGARFMIATGQFGLAQNIPNPCVDATAIPFQTIERGRVRIDVMDVIGRTIATVCDEDLMPGTYVRSFSAAHLPAGIYPYVLRTPNMITRRIMTVGR